MIFLDSSYIKGLILKNDPYAEYCHEISGYLSGETKVTNITVLVEVMNSINKYNFFGNPDDLMNSLLNLNIFDYLADEDYNHAFELFKFYNRSINFADCTIIQSRFNHGIRRIASFDSDFDKIKGFKRIH